MAEDNNIPAITMSVLFCLLKNNLHNALFSGIFSVHSSRAILMYGLGGM